MSYTELVEAVADIDRRSIPVSMEQFASAYPRVTAMSDMVRFAQPPVIELIFGMQFSPLSRITTAHLGWFWRELGADWVDLADGPVVPDQFIFLCQLQNIQG